MGRVRRNGNKLTIELEAFEAIDLFKVVVDARDLGGFRGIELPKVRSGLRRLLKELEEMGIQAARA